MISGAVGPLPPIHRFGGSSSTSLWQRWGQSCLEDQISNVFLQLWH
jgi:hypothetical protein